MKHIDVIIFVEHIDRELEVAEELAKHVRQLGLSVVILSSIYHVHIALFSYVPKAILTPSTALGVGSIAYNYYHLYGNQIHYANLNYEQFISSWKGNYKNSQHLVFKENQIHYVWGEFYRQILIESDVRESNIIVTGRPYNELVRKRYRGKKQEHKNSICKYHRLPLGNKLMFIALTDGLAYVSEEKIKTMVENGALEKDLRNHVHYVQKNVENIFSDLRKLVLEGTLRESNTTIILRPHPSIPEEHYKGLLNIENPADKNVVITKEQNALMWLSASDLFVTNYSTLAIEAGNINTPVYKYESFEKDINENYWWVESAPKIGSYADFKRLVTSLIDSETIKLNMTEGETKFYIDDELDPFSIISDHLDEIINRNVIPKIQWSSLPSLVRKAGRRIGGSWLRGLSINSGLGKVRAGIRSDYFPVKKHHRN